MERGETDATLTERDGPSTSSLVVEPPGLPCANCGTPLVGPFCAQCGQHVADYHRSVWRFVTDFLDNTFCWDNRLLRTLEPLFLQPGGLTQEFMAGRRVRYVHPLRLFLFTSAVCLALLHFGGTTKSGSDASKKHHRHAKSAAPAAESEADKGAGDDDSPAAAPSPTEAAEAAITKPDASDDPPGSTAAPSAPAADASPDASPSPGETVPDRAAIKTAVRDALKAKLGDQRAGDVAELGDQISSAVEKKVARDGVERFSQQITEGVRQRLSWVALGLLPVFALMLRGLYWQKESFYFLHLVFSLHYHTFLLIFWTAYSWLRAALDGSFLHTPALLCLLLVPAYLFLALRRVYGGSVRRTWTKVVLLGGMHALVIVGALGAIGALAVFSAVR